jgi:hypothetical protein
MSRFMDTKKNWFTFILMLVAISASNTLLAQEPSQKAATQDTTQLDADGTPIIDDGTIKLFLDKIEVVGQLEKPQAVFIVPGSNPEIDDIRIERSFFNEIFRSVERKGRSDVKNTTEPAKGRKDYIPW